MIRAEPRRAASSPDMEALLGEGPGARGGALATLHSRGSGGNRGPAGAGDRGAPGAGDRGAAPPLVRTPPRSEDGAGASTSGADPVVP